MINFFIKIKIFFIKLVEKLLHITKIFNLLIEKNKLKTSTMPVCFKELGRAAFNNNIYLELAPTQFLILKAKLLESQKIMESLSKKQPGDIGLKVEKIQLKKIKQEIEKIFTSMGETIFYQASDRRKLNTFFKTLSGYSERVQLIDNQLSQTFRIKYILNWNFKQILTAGLAFGLLIFVFLMFFLVKNQMFTAENNLSSIANQQKPAGDELQFKIDIPKIEIPNIELNNLIQPKNLVKQNAEMLPSENESNIKKPKIEDIQIQNKFENRLIYELSNSQKKVVGLDLKDYFFTDNELIEILKKYGEINLLILKGSNVTNSDISSLATLKKLEILDLSSTKISDSWIKNLQSLKQLKTLDLSFTEITDRALNELLSLTNISKLNLAKTRITDEGAKLLKNMINLTWINLYSTDITAASLPSLVNIPSLKYINLSSTFLGKEQDLDAVELKHFKDAKFLEILDIDFSSIVKLKPFSESNVLHKIPTISRNINGDTPLKPEDVYELNFTNMGLQDDDLDELRIFTNLKVLNLKGNRITKDGLIKLAPLKALETLFVEDGALSESYLGTNRTSNGMRNLQKIGLLHTLYYAKNGSGGRPKNNNDVEILDFRLAENNYPKHFRLESGSRNNFLFETFDENGEKIPTTTGYIHFPNLKIIKGYNTIGTLGRSKLEYNFQWAKIFPKLESIDFEHTIFTDEELKRFSELTNLNHFSVTGSYAHSERGFPRDFREEYPSLALFTNLKSFKFSSSPLFIETNAKFIAKLEQLDSLSIIAPKISQRILKDLSPLKNLTSLKISTDNVGLYEIKNFSKLKTLDLSLSSHQLSDEGVEEINVLTNLESLNLSNTAVTCKCLKPLKKLNFLTNLDLSNTKISDDGFENIASLNNLKDLNLTQTEITGAAIQELAKIKGLKTIKLKKSGINDIALKELQRNLPDCKILLLEND